MNNGKRDGGEVGTKRNVEWSELAVHSCILEEEHHNRFRSDG